MDAPDPEALARSADNLALASRRRGAWRVWSDGAITSDGSRLCMGLSGARSLRLALPRASSEAEFSYAWVTKRDAVIVRDAIAVKLGCAWSARWPLLRRAGEPDPDDRLPWSFALSPGSPETANAVRRLRVFAEASDHPGMCEAVRHLLVAHEFEASLPDSDRSLLEIYAEACGATYGDPDVGAAIVSLLGEIDRGGATLNRVSVARDSAGGDSHGGVRVDLVAIARSCEDAIAGRPRDGSVPRVVISADVLLSVASYAKGLVDEASRSLSAPRDPGVPHSMHWAVLAELVAQGPIVGGAAAADAWGEVVHPFVGYPPSPPSASPGGAVSAAAEDPLDAILASDQRAALGSIAEGCRDWSELVDAVRLGLSALDGAPFPDAQRVVLERYVALAPGVLGTLGEAKPMVETWAGVRSVRSLLRAVDVATGVALPRWTPERARAVDAWWSRCRDEADPAFDDVRSFATGAISRALWAARSRIRLSDDDRSVIEDLLSSLRGARPRQIWAVNLRSLLAAIPLQSSAEREARAYLPPRFTPASPDSQSSLSDLCSTCDRSHRRHYSLARENRCHPIDFEISDRELRAAEALGKIPAISRVVLWRISAVDRSTGDDRLAVDVDTGLASLDTSGHVSAPALDAARGWLGDHKYRDADDAVVVAIRTLVDVLSARGGDRG